MVSNRSILSLFLGCLAVLSAATAESENFDGLLQLRHSTGAQKIDPAISRLSQSGRFNTLISLLTNTGLISAFESLDKLTLFAPNDKAFASVNPTLSSLSHDQVLELLQFHALPEYYNPLQFINLTGWIRTVASGDSSEYELKVEESSYYNIVIDSGVNKAAASWIFDRHPVVVYEIDAVLIPKELQTVSSAPAAAPATAPESESVVPAAAAPPTAPATAPESLAPAPAAPAAAAEAIQALEETGEFKSLLSLLEAESLVTLVESLGSFTLFAPTDTAFNELPAGALDKLSTSETVDVLEFHLVPEYQSVASLLSRKDPVATLASSGRPGKFQLKFSDKNGALTIDTGVDQVNVDSNVFDSESVVVVYAVDKLLLPPEVFGPNNQPSPAPSPSPASQFRPPPPPPPPAAPAQVPSAAPQVPAPVPEAANPLPSPARVPAARAGAPPSSAANSLPASLWMLGVGLIPLYLVWYF